MHFVHIPIQIQTSSLLKLPRLIRVKTSFQLNFLILSQNPRIRDNVKYLVLLELRLIDKPLQILGIRVTQRKVTVGAHTLVHIVNRFLLKLYHLGKQIESRLDPSGRHNPLYRLY